MTKSLILTAAAIALAGCAVVRTKTTYPVFYQNPHDTNQIAVAYKTTRATAYTLFDANSEVTKLSVRGDVTRSNEWSSGTYVGGINQSSSSTGVVNIIEAAAYGAAKGAAAAAGKP